MIPRPRARLRQEDCEKIANIESRRVSRVCLYVAILYHFSMNMDMSLFLEIFETLYITPSVPRYKVY